MSLFDLLPWVAVLLASFNLLIFRDLVSTLINTFVIVGGIAIIIIRFREDWR